MTNNSKRVMLCLAGYVVQQPMASQSSFLQETLFFKNNVLKFSYKILDLSMPFILINPLYLSLFSYFSTNLLFLSHIPFCTFKFPSFQSFATIKASLSKDLFIVLAPTVNSSRSHKIRDLKLGSTYGAECREIAFLSFLGFSLNLFQSHPFA